MAKIRTSQVIAVVVVIIVASRLILWVRGDDSSHIAQSFPLLGGFEPSWAYDFLGGGMMLLIALWGFVRMKP
jgi:formate hydrogenlyase subunit 3/multisubunit Na+/H+ antiporter MnhD subunit